MADDLVGDVPEKLESALNFLKESFSGIRTGRAHPGLVSNVIAEVYGDRVPISQLAGILCPEPRVIVIEPYDKTTGPSIVKAISQSDLGLSPSPDGEKIRIVLPLLTEERRRDYIRLARNRTEDTRVAVRRLRQQANDAIKRQKKADGLSEDIVRGAQTTIQKLVDQSMKTIDELLVTKEKEIERV